VKLKNVESIAKYGGIIAVVFEWSALLSFYLSQPSAFNGAHPISYFASLPQTRFIFSLCYCVAALSFWVFTKYHLNKYLQTPVRLFTVSMLGFAAVALLPFNPDSRLLMGLHNFAFLIFATTFLAGMYLMAKRSKDRVFSTVSFALIALGCLLLATFATLQSTSFVLMSEVGWGLVCQLWILWVSYHSYRLGPR